MRSTMPTLPSRAACTRSCAATPPNALPLLGGGFSPPLGWVLAAPPRGSGIGDAWPCTVAAWHPGACAFASGISLPPPTLALSARPVSSTRRVPAGTRPPPCRSQRSRNVRPASSRASWLANPCPCCVVRLEVREREGGRVKEGEGGGRRGRGGNRQKERK
jgi:hypothetical protein